MKVAVLYGPGDLRLDDAQRPAAGPGDVVIKVAAAGICGTDLHFRKMGTRFNRPMPLGHEFAGEVVEVGSKVQSFKAGNRVAYNSYNSPADIGRGGECGGFSSYVVLREVDGHVQSLCRVPQEVSLEHAALVEPISVGAHAVNRADPKPGESVAIFGVGPIGLGVIMALRWRGIEDIVAFDLSPLRRERARALGARAVFDPRANPPAAVLAELRGSGTLFGQTYPRTDVYIEASGAAGLLSEIATFCNKGQPHRNPGHTTPARHVRRHEADEQGDQRHRFLGLSERIPAGDGEASQRGSRSRDDDHPPLPLLGFPQRVRDRR